MSDTLLDQFFDAAIYGDTAKVIAMLDRQPDLISARDKYEFTVLHVLMTEEQPAMAMLLLDRGADLHARNDDELTPLHLAQYAEMAKVLLGRGADVNARERRGRTPLHIAAQESEDAVDLDVLAVLLESGADRSLRDTSGKTPLDYALSREDAEKIAMLK